MLQEMQCELICESAATSLTQVYTGFGLLARQGKIKVARRRAPEFSGSPVGSPYLTVIVNNRVSLIYDTADSSAVDTARLNRFDFYFKRSYDPAAYKRLDGNDKIRPFGLNYPTYGPGDGALRLALWGVAAAVSDLQQMRLVLTNFVRASEVLSRVFKANGGRHTSDFRRLSAPPKPQQNPRVAFFARIWDPARVQASRPHLADERRAMNEMRVGLIRSLRRELGDRFIGGLASTPDALALYPDCVVDVRFTRKEEYLNAIRHADVGIATVGLQRSNGWKLAEYVALSRAIVTEPLAYGVPGPFEAGRNYLEFRTVEEGVARASDLLGNPEQREAMMKANATYYQAHLRPDMLVMNSLRTVVGT